MRLLYDEIHLMKAELLNELGVINKIIERLYPKDNSKVVYKLTKTRTKKCTIKNKIFQVLKASKEPLYPQEIKQLGGIKTTVHSQLHMAKKNKEVKQLKNGRYKIA